MVAWHVDRWYFQRRSRGCCCFASRLPLFPMQAYPSLLSRCIRRRLPRALKQTQVHHQIAAELDSRFIRYQGQRMSTTLTPQMQTMVGSTGPSTSTGKPRLDHCGRGGGGAEHPNLKKRPPRAVSLNTACVSVKADSSFSSLLIVLKVATCSARRTKTKAAPLPPLH